MSNFNGNEQKIDRNKQPDRIIGCAAPSIAQLERWMDDGGCEAVECGCWIETDGTCEHGNKSWLLHLGMI